MKLTDVAIRKARPAEKGYKLADGAGLHLFVSPAGGKLWRFRYEFGGKEKLLSIGPYPAVSIVKAREAREQAKAILREGRDPSTAKRVQQFAIARDNADTFEVIAREWHQVQRGAWTETHMAEVLKSLEKDVFPRIGDLPIRQVIAPQVLDLLRAVENRGAKEIARRIRQRISWIFAYAIASGKADADPAGSLHKVMAPMIKGRQPAITDLAEARKVLERAEATPAHPVTKLALRLLAITAIRPGTLTGTPWAEFADLSKDDPVWQISAARMKLRLQLKSDEARDHLVPLAPQAVETIAALRSLSGRCPLVFPNTRHPHKPMSENAIGYLLNRAGYHHRHVPHGWRSTFSTVMNERYPGDSRIIDLMLAHTPKDRVEGAYNRAAHLQRRTELARIWADLIMEGRPPAADLLKMSRR